MSAVYTDIDNGILRARDAAEQLFRAKRGDPLPEHEPSDREAATAAVGRLKELFDELPGFVDEMMEGSREIGGLLSSDRLQGLAEIVQNADDVQATQVRIILQPNGLWICHDGMPVRLPHVLGMATPWLSTKRDNPHAMGRFGIGLMTLRALSDTIEVHCDPYHVRLESSSVLPIEPATLPEGIDETGWTAFRIPIDGEQVSVEELEEWLDGWDDTALLFLQSVLTIALLDREGHDSRELSLCRHNEGEIWVAGAESARAVPRKRVQTSDGRAWLVYNDEVQSPEGVTRTQKATDPTTLISVALPLDPSECDVGRIYAGLPVSRSPMPVFVNAQFDPMVNRGGLADTQWNRSLLPFVAELWSQAVLDFFSVDPKSGWHAIPVGSTVSQRIESPIARRLGEAIVEKARHWISSQLSFTLPDRGDVKLSDLAVEVEALEEILTDSEIAHLANLPATLPAQFRDDAGRWRLVLDEWRDAGADLPQPVEVFDALNLIEDPGRSADSIIKLAATGIEENLGRDLMSLSCVITDDDRRIVPPPKGSTKTIATHISPLAQQLNVATQLHDAHTADTKPARIVFDWLREIGSVLESTDDISVVRYLAEVGRSHNPQPIALSDEQVGALRAAFELIDQDERQKIGPDVGRAILLEGKVYEAKSGRKRVKSARICPRGAYLPGAVDRDRESFAAAADKTSGLAWLDDRYARILRSSAGREGVGAQRFLGLLGANRVPLPRPHPGLIRRYMNSQRGLPSSITGGPSARTRKMRELGATYTLQDSICPDLVAVAGDISRMRFSRQRRQRASALLATMSRAWEQRFGDFIEVNAASDYHGWNGKGRVVSYWLWQLREIAWLDDESGVPRRPSDLWIRSRSTEAIHGNEHQDYLHPDLNRSNQHPVLNALGVSGEPGRSELVKKLKELKESTAENGQSNDKLMAATGVVYKALAQSIASNSRPDLNLNQLRQEFRSSGGLILTNLGWQPPQTVFLGPPIFRNYRAFAPQLNETTPLWTALNLRSPSTEDHIDVIRDIVPSRRRKAPTSDEEAILLEVLRELAIRLGSDGAGGDHRKLSQLPLWTRKGWMRRRPVYATDDPVLADGLGDHVHLWVPGGNLNQFRSLLDPLRITEIVPADFEVADRHLAEPDPDSTDLFRSAVTYLQDDLSRNDPQLAQGIQIPWDRLKGFSVYIHPSLTLEVDIAQKNGPPNYKCEVTASVDMNGQIVFVKSYNDLSHANGGGRALAILFEGDARSLAQAWRAACDEAFVGGDAKPVELAHQLAFAELTRNETAIDGSLASIQSQVSSNHHPAQQSNAHFKGKKAASRTAGSRIPGRSPTASRDTRNLVDPAEFQLLNPETSVDKGAPPSRSRTRPPQQLVQPSRTNRGINSTVPPRAYTDSEREEVGLEFVKMLLGSDDNKIVELRGQYGVGADAIDDMGRYYELKVSGQHEPDIVRMTYAEIQRAAKTENFFLVVVSGIETNVSQPTVRIIANPLTRLTPVDRGEIMVSGIRSVKSLIYRFGQSGDLEMDLENESTAPS